jgi:hypothetical protein
MYLTTEQASNLNRIFGILSLNSQSDVIPAIQIDFKDDEAVLYIDAAEVNVSITEELSDEGFGVLLDTNYLSVDF